MSSTDPNYLDRIKALEEENKEFKKKLLALGKRVDKKVSDYEEESRDATERIKSLKNESIQLFESIKVLNDQLSVINESANRYEILKNEIVAHNEIITAKSTELESIINRIEESDESIIEKMREINNLYSNKPTWEEGISTLEEILKRGDDYDSKLGTLNKAILDRKKEIDSLYYDIIGYTENNDEGEEVLIEGMKQELENSYEELKVNIKEIQDSADAYKQRTIEQYNNFTKDRMEQYNSFIKAKEQEYLAIVKKINDLLPDALTAGLSHAYQIKKDTEIAEYKNLSKNFIWAIWGLVSVSLLPVLVTVGSILFQDISIQASILRIPRLVLAIAPLYIPILWVAYSSNKKRNLSKRLIEEYTHKETLSKTFEGLANQINSLEDKAAYSELRVKLLYNLLEVNSQNPGKLISDYNTSDHPLMDALDKSVALTDAITRLSKIPGFNKLASKLGQKAEHILAVNNEKANNGLDVATFNEEDKINPN